MITLAVFLTLLLLGFPIFAAILLAAIVFMAINDLSILFDGIPLQLYSALDANSLLAIPLFVLVGEIMNKGGLTQRLIAVAELLTGRVKGGLAYANLITNAMAASILGSAIAQIGVMSRVMIPVMTEKGYDKGFASAVTVSGGLLGPIFPPSMLMIIYGVRRAARCALVYCRYYSGYPYFCGLVCGGVVVQPIERQNPQHRRQRRARPVLEKSFVGRNLARLDSVCRHHRHCRRRHDAHRSWRRSLFDCFRAVPRLSRNQVPRLV